MRWGVLLSGEHATLPAAELEALLAVHAPNAEMSLHGLLAVAQGAGVEAGLRRMAMATEWGRLWAMLPPEAQPQDVADAIAVHADGNGTFAVRWQRRGAGKASGGQAFAGAAGRALVDAGHAINLENPKRTLAIWFLPEAVAVVEVRGTRPIFSARVVEERSHFSPVSLHPSWSSALLHLARAKPGARVLDPFCGTGGIVLEAALEGYDAWGSDLDAWMVQGTLCTLADAGPDPLDGTVFEADIGQVPRLVERVDAVVTDLPYGRASGTEGEPIGTLHDRALAAFHRVLSRGGRAVVGHADATALRAQAHGFEVEATFEQFVHKSLTRRFVVLRKR